VADVGTVAVTCNGSTATPASGYFATDGRGIIFQSDQPMTNPIQPSARVVAMQ
jgi:hypothetical protein